MKQMSGWLVIVLITCAFIVIGALVFLAGMIYLNSDTSISGKSVAVIPISGLIVDGEQSSLFSSSNAQSSKIIEYIKNAENDNWISAIVLEINSPGGTIVPSKEIADAVRKSKKPVIAVIRSVGASGAYLIAAASDVIIADELSQVGSIGVISSYLEFNGLLESYNITYRRLVSGKHKDMGIPYRELTVEEEEIIQSDLDFIYDYFVGKVAFDRNLSIEEVKNIADGRVFFGIKAKEMGLVDVLGNMETSKEILKSKFGIENAVFKYYKKQGGFMDILYGTIKEQSYFVGQGISSNLIPETGIRLE